MFGLECSKCKGCFIQSCVAYALKGIGNLFVNGLVLVRLLFLVRMYREVDVERRVSLEVRYDGILANPRIVFFEERI